jgi:hypothetical protein
MIGHPTQTLEDVQAIADLSKEVLAVGKRVLGKKANVRIGVSTLVPKPQTPFQWVPMESEERHQRSRLPSCSASCAVLASTSRGIAPTRRWSKRSSPVATDAWARSSSAPGNMAHAWKVGASSSTLAPGMARLCRFCARVRCKHGLVCSPRPHHRRGAALGSHFGGRSQALPAGGVRTHLCRRRGGRLPRTLFQLWHSGQFKEQRREAADDGWCCPPLGKGKDRQPVSRTRSRSTSTTTCRRPRWAV